MRKPNIEEFFDEATDSYNYDEYYSVIGDYADEQRDLEIERQWEEEENEK